MYSIVSEEVWAVQDGDKVVYKWYAERVGVTLEPCMKLTDTLTLTSLKLRQGSSLSFIIPEVVNSLMNDNDLSRWVLIQQLRDIGVYIMNLGRKFWPQAGCRTSDVPTTSMNAWPVVDGSGEPPRTMGS